MLPGAKDEAMRRRIVVNMERWRWLPRDRRTCLALRRFALTMPSSSWAGARFPETVCCATDRIDGGRAWTERMGWNRV